MDKGTLCQSCKYGETPMSAHPCSMCWNPAGDMFEPISKKQNSASDEVILKLVDALSWIKNCIETDYMLDGEWVDNPKTSEKYIHRTAEQALEKAKQYLET